MAAEPQQAAAGGEPRLHFEDEAGQGSGRRDVAVLVIAVALFALAAVIANDASGYVIRRSYARFGPEIVPYIVATGIAALGVITAIMGWRGRFEAREALNFGGMSWLLAGITAEIVMLYGGAGFIPGSGVLFACAARAFGQRTLALNLGIGLALSAALFVLFRHGLGLSLPDGPLERGIDLLLR
jgi:putative tricarboxylic transport membrane protein